MSVPRARLLAAVTCVAPLLFAAGCKSLDEGAREAFSSEFSCPEARVEVHARQDLGAYEITFGPGAPPPAEVRNDPERYALWQKQQRDQHASWNDRISVFEARGCGHDVLYTCSHPNGSRGGINLGQASCSKANHQEAAGKR